MTKFHEDLELSVKAEQYQNNLYREIFDIKNINRFANKDGHILDVKYHIDVELELNNGIKLLGQEKALRNEFSKFNTFTIEFYQNRFTKEKGEFFNLGAQFYLHSYWNKNYDGFEKWYLIKIFDFLTWLKKSNITDLENQTRASTSKASFYFINYDKIPKEFIYENKT
jgi:hypothetical protein